MSGTLHAGDDLDNVTRGSKERLAQILLRMRPNQDSYRRSRSRRHRRYREDERCTHRQHPTKRGSTGNMTSSNTPLPSISVPYVPLPKATPKSSIRFLPACTRKIPHGPVEQSKELKQTILSGMGEFHLRTLKWRVENNDKLPSYLKNPRFLTAKPSQRHHVPTIATRNSRAVPDGLARYT